MKKELSQTRLAEIKDGADIFVSMEQAGILTPTNLNYLIEYFGYIDRNDLRNIAIAFQCEYDVAISLIHYFSNLFKGQLHHG